MKVSLSWLREYVDWTGSVDELVGLLTRTGLEVKEITTRGADFPNVVVGQILESSGHPNADRLSVCRVDDGSGHPRQIVCGAKNYRVGDKVPVALPGAVLPGNFKIKVGKLRGVESEGMLCSGKELNLADDADGLLILAPEAPVGAPISSLYPVDTLMELEVTPNRGDWLSHVGVARELAAFTGVVLKPAPVGLDANRTDGAGSVTVTAPEKCPFYSVRRIRGVKVGPSPQWLRDRLESVGLRSINSVVDVTNFVLMESGQPLHAFDAAKISGGLTVRLAAPDEKFLALDGKTYSLSPENLVIADTEKPVAIAGVMGGEDSGVTESTVDILLESALFDASTVRRTARTLDLHSDSSHRFERGVAPSGVLSASARAAALIGELAGGAVDGEVLVVGSLPKAAAPIQLSHAHCRTVLGGDVADEAIRLALQGLGLDLITDSGQSSTWQVPDFRGDLTREIDLIEEVSRVVGMETLSGRIAAVPVEPGEADARYDFQMEIRRKLVGLGLSEARTSALISQGMLWQNLPALRVKNPLGEDQAFLRNSLLPGLLHSVERNIRQGAKTIALFEVGRTFHAADTEEVGTLGIALHGQAVPADWRGGNPRPLDWHDARGWVDSLVGRHQLREETPVAPLGLASGIYLNDQRVGSMGQLSPQAARRMDATGPVLVVELNLEMLRAASVGPTYREIAKYPAVTRDVAIVCPLDLPFAEIENTLSGAGEKLLENVVPFDVFTDPSGEKLVADRKSIAISLTFRDSGRTLESEEVSAACERLRQLLKKELPVDFRE